MKMTNEQYNALFVLARNNYYKRTGKFPTLVSEGNSEIVAVNSRGVYYKAVFGLWRDGAEVVVSRQPMTAEA